MTLQWDGDHYAEHTAHHRAYDDVLLARLGRLAPDADIVDVGCGVGDFTRGLLSFVPRGSVRGVDADPSMIATAQQRARALAPNTWIAFDVCRAEDLGSVVDAASIDLLLSTACLHWLPRDHHQQFLAAANTVLRSEGRMLVEFGGAGQLEDVRGVLDPLAVALGGRPPTWWFASTTEYEPLLASAGFAIGECALVRQQRAMTDPEALRGWLTSQVLVGYRPWIPDAAWGSFVDGALARVEALVKQPDGSCDVEYVRLVIDATPSRR